MTTATQKKLSAPDSERAYLAGLLELLTDDAPRARDVASLVAAEAFTIEGGRELYVAILATLEAHPQPGIVDLWNDLRSRGDNGGDGLGLDLSLDLLHASTANRHGYALQVERRGKEVAKAASRLKTAAAAEHAAAVAADPSADPAEVEAAVAAVAAAGADVGSRDVLEWIAFPVDVLPEPAGSFVRSAADSIGCDPAMVALPLLSALAAAIGNTRRLEVKPGWLEPPVLWTSVVAESGSQKTPAFNAAMQFLEKRQTAAFTEHAEQMRNHDADLAQHDAEMGAWKAAVRKGNAGSAPIRPVAPVATRYYVSDTTIEAMIPILAGNPRGLLVAVDEQAGWLASFDQYRSGRGGADAPKWLSMHTAGSVVSDRKSTGTAYVPSAAVSVAGGIQPGALRRAIGTQHVENGMLARLLVAMPPRRPKVWHNTQPDFIAVGEMAAVFDVLLDVPSAADGPAVADFTHEAGKAWQRFYNSHGQEQNEATGALASMLAKIEAAAARLALVIHCVRQAAGQRLPHRIDEVSVEAGVTLARWFAREARRVYGELGAGEAADGAAGDAAEAFRWIESRGGYSTVRDLARGLRRFRNDDGRAEKTARRLVAAGRAEWSVSAPGEAGGRPGDGIRLVAR